MPKIQKVPIAERALLARLNRHLKSDGRLIKKCRPATANHAELGDYFAVDVNTNSITAKHIDLVEWGTECGVLKPFEDLKRD